MITDSHRGSPALSGDTSGRASGPHAFDHFAPLPPLEQPLVTVVVPVYNGAPHIADCVRSVVGQTYANWELFVVDNSSGDGTPEVASRAAEGDPRVHIQLHDELVPVYRNHNRALTYVGERTVYVKTLHADDFLHPDSLMQMVALAEANPSVGLVSAYRMLGNGVASDGRLPIERSTFGGREIGRRGMLCGTPLFGTPSSVLIRTRDLPLREKVYNEENLHGDSELCFDILTRADFGFVHQVLSYSRVHEKSVTSRHGGAATMLPAHIGILLRHGSAFLSDAELSGRLSAQLRRYSVTLLKRSLRGVPWRNDRFLPYHERELDRLRVGARAAGASLLSRALIAPWRVAIPLARRLRDREVRNVGVV